MALSVGSITIDPDTGEHSGSGYVYEMFDAWWTSTGSTFCDGKDAAFVGSVKSGIVPLLQSIAAGTVAEMANATIGSDVTSTWTPGSIAAAGYASKSITVAGVSYNEPVVIAVCDASEGEAVNPRLVLSYFSASGTVQVRLFNPTTAAITPGTLAVTIRRVNGIR